MWIEFLKTKECTYHAAHDAAIGVGVASKRYHLSQSWFILKLDLLACMYQKIVEGEDKGVLDETHLPNHVVLTLMQILFTIALIGECLSFHEPLIHALPVLHVHCIS
jgi:hypothetical protein